MHLFDRPIVAFDLETIPDPEVGRRVLGLEGSDLDVVREMARRRREETNGATDFVPLPWHRVVCACATVWDPAHESLQIRALGGDALDERSHLAGFFQLFEEPRPRLVSWNGGGFDLPVLRYRGMRHGLAAPGLYRAGPEGGYHHRQHDLHVDLMDVLSGHGSSARASLGAVSKLLDLPAKAFLDRPIHEHVLDGGAADVLAYCKLDTLDTLLLFLLWSLHVGTLEPHELRRAADQVRAAVAREPYPGFREVAAGLEGWPRFVS
jgi:predicted PolB exonuclease-like 3'-5' exonuclease